MKQLITLHKDFKINGISHENVEALLAYARSFSKDLHAFLTFWFDDKDFITVKTSGSTGKSTSMQLKKEFMVNSAIATGDYFDLSQKTKALLCLSPNYIAGKMMLVRAMELGWDLDTVEPDSNPLDKTKGYYDFCAMVPMQLSASLTQLHRVKKLIVGGAPISQGLKNKLQSMSTEVFATYGMTETITHIAVKKLNHLENLDLKSRSYYTTLPNIQISKDRRGCLVVVAPKLSETRIVTNDLVELISDNQFEWLGRHDTVINSGGIKLIPEQIEEKLAQIIPQRLFVTGLSDEILGEKLVLIIEGGNKNLINIQSKISQLKSLLKYEHPKEIYFIEHLVETETKKIQRQKTLDLIFSN